MRRRGQSAEAIDQMIYRNPIKFLEQCPKFKLPGAHENDKLPNH
jgi:hypothetical protein